jgi:hypothetical protein
MIGKIKSKDILNELSKRELKLANLEKENAELKENFRICEKNADTYFDNLIKAKKIIENIIQVTWGEGWNYSLDWKVKAEQFLKENEKHHYEAEVINGKLTGKAILVPDSLAYAKSIIEQLMNMKNLSDNEQIEVIKKAKAFLH